MKIIKACLFISTIALLIVSCSSTKKTAYKYTPVSQELYDSIVQMDSMFFHAYNTCDLETQAAIYSDSIEFYHDKAGLITSKQAILDATKKNICGKVNRELVKGSIEVYPIKDFGAVETGLHKFHNNVENVVTDPDKFIIIWKHANGQWKITRVISLH